MSTPFRVVIACGGTGGHLFRAWPWRKPETARTRDPPHRLRKSIDSLALKAHPEFRAEKLPSIGMPSVLSPAFVRFLRRSWESLGHCRDVYRRFRPSAVLGMGGFTSTAPLLAGRMQKLPTFIHESNAIPAGPTSWRRSLSPRCCSGSAPADSILKASPMR